jgi:hypothetical protein
VGPGGVCGCADVGDWAAMRALATVAATTLRDDLDPPAIGTSE